MFNTLHILIVDDHAFQRRALTSMVTQLAPDKISEAADGDEAIKVIANEDVPDIVICDLAMPNTDGLALLRHLSEQAFSGSIILCSAADASLVRAAANLVRAGRLNLLGAMEKPCSQRQLSYYFNQHQKRINQAKQPYQVSLNPTPLDIQEALNKQQFTVLIQPQVAFDNGECVGFEALCRWQHPTHGLVSPFHFITEVEQAGLMPQLSLEIIKQSVSTLAQLPSEFSRAKISINLTPSCLTNELTDELFKQQSLLSYAKQKRISFEITEQTELLNTTLALEVLSRLRMHGFNLSVDDFGTGYSSLQQLSQYPFNELKLDKSFVQYADSDPQSEAIVDISIELAKRLDMNVVVEGVETEAQWRCMQSLGAQLCQGYFCAKPMPASELSSWYNDWRVRFKQLQAINANLNKVSYA